MLRPATPPPILSLAVTPNKRAIITFFCHYFLLLVVLAPRPVTVVPPILLVVTPNKRAITFSVIISYF